MTKKRMRQKMNIKKQVIIVLAACLTVSNAILVYLLFYNFYVELAGVHIPIDGEMVEFHFTDHFAERLLIIGVISAVLTTGAGILTASYLINRLLDPVNRLSRHMSCACRESMIDDIEMQTFSRETEILKSSFNSMAASIRESFEIQKNTASYIAHELRNPLTVMQTKIDVYKKMEEEDPESLIKLMDQQISRMNVIIRKILEFSDIQRIELSDLIPVYILIEEVFDDLEEKAGLMDVNLSVINLTSLTDEELQHKEVLGNHDLLYQAFYNIIENAVKYNVSGGSVKVCISIEDDRIHISITDTASRIPDEEKDRIFSPFYRCRKDINSDSKGNGIGLALTERIIRHHGGYVGIADDSSCSNTFDVILNLFCGDRRSRGRKIT